MPKPVVLTKKGAAVVEGMAGGAVVLSPADVGQAGGRRRRSRSRKLSKKMLRLLKKAGGGDEVAEAVEAAEGAPTPAPAQAGRRRRTRRHRRGMFF